MLVDTDVRAGTTNRGNGDGPGKGSILTESQIVSKVAAKAKEATGWYDSRLSKERLRVLEYYNGTLPRKAHMGSSSYVATDVFDSVQMMKAQLLEVFAGGDDIVQFDPDQDMGVADCRAATAYARYVIFEQNPGFKVFHHVMHDGLTARAGVAKVYWDERKEHVDEEFQDLDHNAAMALAAQDDVEEFDAEQDPKTGLYKGRLIRTIDRSQVRIDPLAPEEFLIEPRCVEMKLSGYTAHRSLKAKNELLDMGFDPEKVRRVHYDDARGLDLSPEVLARNAPVETVQALQNPIQPDTEKIMLYEEYVRIKIDPKKGVRLYKIMRADATIFEYEEVEKVPFIPYIPLPVPHIFYGDNYAARVIPYQNAQTVLIRSVLDHASITTNPRWAVVKGGLLNPREMIDNRLGGIVNVSRPDSVAALQVPNLNPFIFEIVQKLGENKENSTGISALSQGLNKDAISKQNSAGLVDNLVQLSSQRQKIIARQFAYGFLVPLMLEVMRLVCMHEKKPKIIQVAGQPINVTPEQWTERTTCTVSMHLGYGEKDQALQKMQLMYQGLSQDPVMGPGFGYPQRYMFWHDAGKLAGINTSPYLLPPQQVKPPQPDPLKVAEVQAKTVASQAQMLTAQTTAEKDKRLAAVDAAKISQGQQQIVIDAMEHDRTHTRQDLETANNINVSQREIALEEEMRPQELQAQKEAKAAMAKAAAKRPKAA